MCIVVAAVEVKIGKRGEKKKRRKPSCGVAPFGRGKLDTCYINDCDTF